MTDPISLVEQVSNRLRAGGGRMTAQRRLVLETLEGCLDHPTAEEIYERASKADGSLHLSTVYRTLHWLAEEGLVSPRWFEDERPQQHFDPVSLENSDHHHFRCKVCNNIIEFSEPLIETIKQVFEQRHGARVESATLTLYGVCQECE
jgi:Fe2+ or Zn2+ uptake regulation protein